MLLGEAAFSNSPVIVSNSQSPIPDSAVSIIFIYLLLVFLPLYFKIFMLYNVQYFKFILNGRSS